MKKFIQNLSFIVAGIICLYIAYITGTGEILNYIHFADPLNEMFFCIASMMLGGSCIFAGLSKS